MSQTDFSALLPRNWVTGGINDNPPAGTVLAATPALRGGAYSFTITCWSDTIVDIFLEERNTANSANIKSQKIRVPATSLPAETFEFTVNDGELVRIELDTDLSGGGHIQASIFYKRVS